MAIKLAFSSKHLQINKANTSMVVAVAISSFVVVFSLVAVKALISQRNYQARVINKKEVARDQLNANIASSEALVTAYKNFVGSSQNMLGGDPKGAGDRDGDNAKLILDALPSKYDFPALTTSVEKLILQNSLKIESITGTDDQLAQQDNEDSANPEPVEMPFEVTVAGTYDRIKNIVSVFEKSIRPLNAISLKLTATEDQVQLELKAKSYYQPAKNLKIRTEVVK